LNLFFVGPRIWGHLPTDQVWIACEEIKKRLVHLNPLIIMKDGDNPDEIQAVIDEVFWIGGNA